jgi:hypothetical protein
MDSAFQSEPYSGSGLRAPLGYTDKWGPTGDLRDTSSEPSRQSLAGRFMKGAANGAIDMVWQPVAQVLDLGQAAYGVAYNLATGGIYDPHWFSGTAQNYAAGMSWGETGLRSMTGIPLVGQALGVGLASYDLTSSALQGDWGRWQSTPAAW